MLNLADDFEREDLDYQLDLIRLEEGETEQAIRRLILLQRDILQALREIDPAGTTSVAARRARLEKFLDVISVQMRRTYAAIARRQEEVAAAVAEDTSDRLAEVLLLLLGIDLLRALTKNQATTLAGKPLYGETLADSWKVRSAGDLVEIRVELSRAVEGQQTLSRMVDILKGTAQAKSQDGLFAAHQRHAETLVRTQIQAAANRARYETFVRNPELIKGLQAKNPLDARTSTICRARAGKAWTLDGRALKGTNIVWPGPPPWHFRCRTVLIPIFHRFDDIAGSLTADQRRRLEQLSAEKKVGIDGQPAGELTFQSYLESLSEEQQRKLLGPGRYELWKKKKISMSDLITSTGKPMTLEQLRERVAQRKNRRVPQP